MEERLPGRRPIDDGSLLQRGVDALEVALDGPDVQRHAAQRGDDHRAVAVHPEPADVLAELVEQGIDRHQREHRREHLEDQHAFENRRLAAESHAREGVGAGGREEQDQRRTDQGDLHRVPQPQQHRERWVRHAAVLVGVRNAEGERPVLQCRVLGKQAAGGEVALAKGDRHHHQQREEDCRDEGQQRRVGRPEPVTRGFRLHHGHDRLLIPSLSRV